ncbi:phage portal protein [Gemella sanguinis]|uniref:phage portal protein n=1 Tax=Gemella sanguinis TaxID=84135 RepID=UPI00352F70FD
MAYTETFVDSTGKSKNLTFRFHRESRLRYRVDNVEELILDGYKVLREFISHHSTVQKPRIQELYDYSEGNNHTISIKDRRSEQDMADTRIIHNFGKSIAVFKQGYLVGKPIQVEYDDGEDNSTTDEVLREIAKVNSFHDLNRMLVLDLSKVGRAYDLVYRSMSDLTKVKRLDPLRTFVIYDNTLEDNLLAGVRYYSTGLFDNKQHFVELYLNDRIVKLQEVDGAYQEISIEHHVFRDVPITEYLNTADGMGDYESELALIDSYDAVQSDTANYMTDTSDAILAIFGQVEFPDDVVGDSAKQVEYMRRMRRARLLQLKPPVDVNGNEGTVDAKYLYKQYDVNGVEAFKKRIVNDIHKYTNTPDLTDTNFSGIQSGEAMKYKLFGLEQARVDTQSLFEKSLRRRYQLIANIGDYVKELTEFNIAKLKITFNPNLPKALEETINAFKSLGGMVTNETAMRLTGIVDDPKHEQELLDTPTITLDNSYDLDKGKLMYKISSILKKFKSGDYSEALARKFLKDLGLSEEDIESYLHDGEEVLIDEETII